MSQKQTIGVVVTSETRERIKQVAKTKHWSLSQTLALFIDEYWEKWEKELGIEPKPAKTSKSRKLKADKPPAP